MNSQRTAASRALHDATRVYTRPALRIYDAIIMGLLARWVWRCPTAVFISLYDALVSSHHAEIGVGTGYCLDKCRADIDRLALIDLNPNCLEHSRSRLDRYAPTTHVRNVLERVAVHGGPFKTIALGGVLHCLPGSMQDKGRVFDNLRPILADDAVVFGYTLVSDTGSLGPVAFIARAVLNKLRIVNNYADTSDALRHELDKRFDMHVVTRVGAIAFFIASRFTKEGGEIHAL